MLSFSLMNPMQVNIRKMPAGPTSHTARIMGQLAASGKGQWLVRQTANQIVQNLAEKDYLSEALAIYNWCSQNYRYTRDPYKIELVRDPEALFRELLNTSKVGPRGKMLADCDDISVLIGALSMSVGLPVSYVTAGFHQPGPHSHTWPEAEVMQGRWIMLDPVAGPRMRSMARKVKTATRFRY